jgi:hypothetical protein
MDREYFTGQLLVFAGYLVITVVGMAIALEYKRASCFPK